MIFLEGKTFKIMSCTSGLQEKHMGYTSHQIRLAEIWDTLVSELQPILVLSS